MESPYHIRMAQVPDYPAIVVMLSELAAEEGGICLLDVPALGTQLCHHQPELRIVVAEIESKLIGCLIAYPGFDVLSATRGLHLSDIFVKTSHRQQRVGTLLLAHLSHYGLQHGLEWVSWTVMHSNHGARYFYETLGAVAVDVDFMAMGATSMRQLQSLLT
jgi:ribosomal protein S18 acetylase RimI-like enzyme